MKGLHDLGASYDVRHQCLTEIKDSQKRGKKFQINGIIWTSGRIWFNYDIHYLRLALSIYFHAPVRGGTIEVE